MDLWQLKKILKAKLRPLRGRVKILHYWELLKLKYVNHLEVRDVEVYYQIKQVGNKWTVVSLERGSIIEEKVIEDENKACLYFLELMEHIYENDR